MDKTIIECWSCHYNFDPSSAELGWIASAFEGEDTEAYLCPQCGVPQYGIEIQVKPCQAYLAIWNETNQETLCPKIEKFVSAYDVFQKAHKDQYEKRLLGHADRRLTNAIGVCMYWLRDHQDISFSDFMDDLKNDPLFIHRVRNLGPIRRSLILKYFKKHPAK